MKSVALPWGCWYGRRPLRLTFPAKWKVQRAGMADRPDLGPADLARAFASPIGQEPIRKLAEGKRTAVIAVDDLTRPTQAFRFLPHILRELHQGGIPDERISIVMAIGCHRPMLKRDQEKKLGRAAANQFPVYNNHPYENFVDLGYTSRGTPVQINRFFVEADLRIGVGFITPHPVAGFGGGGKIVIPGLGSMETIIKNHTPAFLGKVGRTGGDLDQNALRLDMEEAARMAGLDVIVNSIGTADGKTAGLVVGDLVRAHRAAVAMAQKIYATPVPAEADIGVFNAFPEDTELLQSGKALNVWTGNMEHRLVRQGGTVVIASASSEGLGFHSLSDRGMRLYRKVDEKAEVKAIFKDRQILVLAPTCSRVELLERYPEKTVLCHRWDEVLTHLASGPRAQSVSVFPNGSLQHLA
ncbi:MAG TPA: nickel-dependent lactate racemase [Candidatus Sulfotelmatobacter sp.]|nr:nickel-dependent lactate racemase [Candidatus Sulfotelmatobacter sp.]